MNAVLSRSREFQHWASLPQSLVELSLSGCNLFDDSFPKDFGSLISLEFLDLSKNLIGSLPDCVRTLRRLETLVLYDCPMLQSVLGIPRTVTTTYVLGNDSLKRVASTSNLTEIMCPYCQSMVKFERCSKSVPFENVDKRIIKNLGLLDLDSRLRGPAKMGLFDDLKVKYEFGIFNTIFPGSEIPGCFSYRKKGSPSISFTVPSLPNNPQIRGLNVCFVNEPQKWWQYPLIKVRNKTKDITWIYGSPPPRFPDYSCDLTMLSHWKLGNLLEVGDEVIVSCKHSRIQVKECGIEVVYDEDEQKGGQNEKETKEKTKQHDTTYLSWTKQSLTELSHFYDSGRSYYFGNGFYHFCPFPKYDS